MSIRIWGIYAVALTCLTTVGLAVAQEQPTTKPAGVPRLELSTVDWNFGEAWQGEPLSKELTVKNAGDVPLEILDVKTSCGCTTPTKPKTPLAPGESSTLTISYNSSSRVGPANQTVTVTSNDPAQPSVGIKVSGTVKALYEIDPKDGLVFGQLYQTSKESKKVVITNDYPEKLALKLKDGQDFGPFQVEVKEIEPGMKFEVIATTKPPLKVGHFQSDIELQTGLERIPSIKTVVFGFIQPPVAVRPAKVFAPKNAVSERKQVLRVSHAPDYPIEVTGVKSSVDAIKVELQPTKQPAPDANAPAEFTIVVTLPPGDRLPDGVQPTIEVMTNAKDPDYQKLTVPIQIIAGPQIQPPTTAPAPAAPPAAPPQPAPHG